MSAGILPSSLPTPAEIESRVAPMLMKPFPAHTYELLAQYINLLYRWNRKMNLTAVRDPRLLVELHLAECLRAAQRIPQGVKSVLDFGSGAGFPGVPIQVARPELHVTLAEQQNKKASFLLEVLRELGLAHASVHSGRVEDLPATTTFDLVTLRAVDKMNAALDIAFPRVHSPQGRRNGWCLVLTSLSGAEKIRFRSLATAPPTTPRPAIHWLPAEIIPTTDQRVLLFGNRIR